MSSEQIQIRFTGASHEIDVNTFINYLVNYNAVIANVCDATNYGDRKVSVKVSAIKSGSFLVCLEMHESIIETLFSSDAVSYLANVAGVLTFVFALHGRLRGRAAKSEKDVEDVAKKMNINISGVTIHQLFKIYNDRRTREPISKSFETLQNDENVEGVEVDCGGTRQYYDREDFEAMAFDDFDSEEEDVTENTEEVDATLYLSSINFSAGKKWTFIYNGVRIFMVVKDDALMARIDAGEKFGKGDAIRVRLRITKRFNKDFNCYENKAYKIVKFYEHLSASEDGRLF